MSEALATVRATDLVTWLERASAAVDAQADWLTELDAAIGDADHGANMRRGMRAAVEAARSVAPAADDAVPSVLKKVAMALISKVGGTSGPLYGTFFLRMSTACAQVPELDLTALTTAVRAGVDGIQARGHAVAGEKTMLDAWLPATASLEESVEASSDLPGAVARAAAAALKGRDATEAMVATKGRASYLGPRSAGHLDPGAASTAIILQALADTVARGDQEAQ